MSRANPRNAFNILLNGVVIESNVKNLREWCRSRNLLYIAETRNKRLRVLRSSIRVNLALDENRHVIENGVYSHLNQRQYAKVLSRSDMFVSRAVRAGYFIHREYDRYTFEEYSAWSARSARRE